MNFPPGVGRRLKFNGPYFIVDVHPGRFGRSGDRSRPLSGDRITVLRWTRVRLVHVPGDGTGIPVDYRGSTLIPTSIFGRGSFGGRGRSREARERTVRGAGPVGRIIGRSAGRRVRDGRISGDVMLPRSGPFRTVRRRFGHRPTGFNSLIQFGNLLSRASAAACALCRMAGSLDLAVAILSSWPRGRRSRRSFVRGLGAVE